jgi:hypothetical protein
VLIARLAAAQVAAFEKLSAEGARTLAVVNERYRLITEVTAQPLRLDAKEKPPRHRAAWANSQ